ncbi:MAG TPA: S1C family serine protease [Planctomycetota bacterium]|jgi:S1-C subfamily serine protease|nr:S1C family serine protease [Planctomycetota bacterium]
MTGILAAILPLLAAPQEEIDKVHARLYRKAAPAVVAVEGGRERGSGVLVDRRGILLTSPTACGASARTVTVITPDGTRYSGRVLGRVPEKELAVVRLEADREFPFLELGDSDAVRPGRLAYVLGDSYDSLRVDGQPALSVGVLSGTYEVSSERPLKILNPFTGRVQESPYRGKVLETSAAVNPHQDGGPLLDREGRVLGLVTLSYDDAKFTGLAIPINEIKPHLERILREAEAPPRAAGAPAVAGWPGAEVRASAGGLEVTRVFRNGPAERAGLVRGDRVTAVNGAAAATEEEFHRALAGKEPGDRVTLTVIRAGERRDVTLTLGRRPLY